jgi:hypothetical protein
MTPVKNDHIREILSLLQKVRAALPESTALERIKVIEKALLQLDAELEPRGRE